MTQNLSPFTTLVLSLVAAGQVQLGLFPDPQTKKTEKNLNAAKETISILEMLKEKTKGNLTKEEEDLFESLLCELRLKFVEKSKE